MTLFNVATCLPHIHTPILHLLKLALLFIYVFYSFLSAYELPGYGIVLNKLTFVVDYLTVSHEDVSSRMLIILFTNVLEAPSVVLGSWGAQLTVDK